MAPLSFRRSCRGVALCSLAIVALAAGTVIPAAEAVPPEVGQAAPDFTLSRLDGKAVQLSQLCEQGPVVLIVLRGFPGYQCPVCTRQVGQFLSQQEPLATARAQVVMVYPGPADGLREHAEEFVTGKTLPHHFHLLIDPDFSFTNAYGLRWDAVGETAYPSTFVLGSGRRVKYAKISRTHGDRANVSEVLKALAQ